MVIPQMNANERKYYLGGFPEYSAACGLSKVSSLSVAKNSINYSRSFAFICGK